MERLVLSGIVVALLSSGACAPAPAPVDEAQAQAAARAGIRQTWEEFIRVWEQGDGAAAAALYTRDAVNMPAYGFTQNGAVEIEESFTEYQSAATIKVLSQKTDEVFVHGDMAYEVGTIVQELTPPEGEPTTLPYRYVAVFQRQDDGSWKFHRWLGQAGE